jgi:hypothetical protein
MSIQQQLQQQSLLQQQQQVFHVPLIPSLLPGVTALGLSSSLI